MALYNNGYRLGNTPYRRGLGALGSIYNGGGSAFNGKMPTSALKSSRGLFGDFASLPSGQSHPVAWNLAQKPGSISGRNGAQITIGGTGSGAMGVAASGTTSITIDLSGTGGLISSASGTADITFGADGTLFASKAVAGEATVTIDGSAIVLALGHLDGTAGTAISAAWTPYAIGWLEGTTAESGLTPNGIAQAVWNTVIESGFSADQILRIIAAYAAGAATGLEGANPQFTGLDGSTLRIDGTYSAGTRTIDALDGD